MKIPSSECIELNNKGTSFMMNVTENEKGGVLKAISFFKKAIDCDSTYLLAYINLANAYDRNREYKEELNISKKILTLSRNNPSMITLRAEAFEKMNLLDSAKRLYQLAKHNFRDSLITHPGDVNFIHGFVLGVALTEGKESALSELNRQIKLNPKLQSDLITDFYFFEDFDKKSYLYHLAQ